MSFYSESIYPHLVTLLGNPKPIAQIRQRIMPLAQGDVLEIGVGAGVNFPLYDSARVQKVYALEPNKGMLRRAEEQRSKTRLQIEFLDLPGERIFLADASVDTVVSTFTLCTIPGAAEALQGLRRVLKPGGKFIFFEHGLSPDAGGCAGRRYWESAGGICLMSDLRELYQEVILEHSKAPRNYRKLTVASHKAEGYNPLCGDHFMVHLNLEGNSIREIGFE